MIDEQKITHLRFAFMRSKLDQFEDESLRFLMGTYKKSIKELLVEINHVSSFLPPDSFTIKRAYALLDESLLMTEGIQKRLTNDIAAMTAEAGVYSYGEINGITSWDGAIRGFDNISLSSSQINALALTVPVGGRILEDWVGRTFKGSIDKIKEEIGVSLVKGESYSKIVKRLTSEFGMLERDAITLARTYVQEINVKAATDVFEANADVVKEVEWTAIMENGNVKTGRGTCPRCQALDGMRYPVKTTNRPHCPLHARCRCMLVPVTKTWKELGLNGDEMEEIYRPWVVRGDRAINIGGVPIIDYGFTDKDYADWWLTRSKAFQNNSIGPFRANLIRSEKLDFEDLVVYNKGYQKNLNRYAKKKYALGDQVRLEDLYRFGEIKPPTPKGIVKKAVKETVIKSTGSMPSLKDIGSVMKKQTSIKKISNSLLAIEKGLEKQRAKYKVSAISERTALYNFIMELNKQKKILESQITIKNMPEVEKLLKPPSGGKINWNIGSVGKTAINKDRKKWNQIIKDAEEMYHPSVLEKLSSILLSRRKNSRAKYTPRNKGILMGNEDTGVFIHEFSHHLEHDRNLYDKAKAFLSSRTTGESLSQISKGEYGWKDKFFNHYCGKNYHHKSTEILSMGVQRMYENPFDFYNTDKEYFEFILKVMWGEI